MVSKIGDAIREIARGTLFELIANELASGLKKAFGALVLAVAASIVALAKGWFLHRVSIPVWAIIVYTLGLVAATLMVSHVVRSRKRATLLARPFHELLWRFNEQGEIVEGPFCPNCKLLMTSLPKDGIGDILGQLDGGLGLPTELECRNCGLRKRYETSLDAIKRDIEDRVAAASR